MVLSAAHRFVFIHVPRAGGQSVSAALEPYASVPRSRWRRADRRLRALYDHNWGHITARELRDALGEDEFRRFYRFSFVRNPWDWQVSTYHYIRQRTDHPDHVSYQRFAGFADYLDWRVNDAGPKLQSELVLDERGEQLVDFVGRYESLARDFGHVREHLGLSGSLPHRNASRHRDFREYYTAETRELAREAYRDDIELFGYEFEGARLGRS